MLGAFVRWVSATDQPHGRLLFPALPAFAILVCLGLSQWSPRRLRPRFSCELALVVDLGERRERPVRADGVALDLDHGDGRFDVKMVGRSVLPSLVEQSVRVLPSKAKQGDWDGVVHLFELKDHPKAKRAYAWSSPIRGSMKPRYFAVLHMGQVTGPVDAVRAAAAAIGKWGAQNAGK